MNVTVQSIMLSTVTRLVKLYPQDERPTIVARRATLSESKDFRNEARSAEKKKRHFSLSLLLELVTGELIRPQ